MHKKQLKLGQTSKITQLDKQFQAISLFLNLVKWSTYEITLGWTR